MHQSLEKHRPGEDTDACKAEECAAASPQTQALFYRSILDAMPLPVSVTDTDGNWVFVNRAAEEFLKSKNEDLIGKPCSNWNAQICGTPSCGIACVKKGITQTFFRQNCSSYQVDVGVLRKSADEVTGFVEIVQNITEIQKMARRQGGKPCGIFQPKGRSR